MLDVIKIRDWVMKSILKIFTGPKNFSRTDGLIAVAILATLTDITVSELF